MHAISERATPRAAIEPDDTEVVPPFPERAQALAYVDWCAPRIREIGFWIHASRETSCVHCKCWMMETIGRNSAITIVPTISARNTIMNGSMTDVRLFTALSTSSS